MSTAAPATARPHLFRAAEHSHLTPWLAALQAQCITHDRVVAAAPFLPPLSHEKLLAWWKDRIAEVRAGARCIVMLLLHHPHDQPAAAASSSAAHQKVKGEDLVGVVMLAHPPLEAAPFRARVESLLVSTKYRRRGGATVLLRAVHDEARRAEKTLLLAEVESGTPAEALLRQQWQYQEIGKVPKYAINPSGEAKDVVFLYRDL